MFSHHSGVATRLIAAFGFTLLAANQVAAQEVHQAEVAQAAMGDRAAGEKGYTTNCRACHQQDGTGLAGAFPPLAGNPHIVNDPAYVAGVILSGKSGKLEVLGKSFDAVMPPMNHLADQEVADIVTFVLNSWGNGGAKMISVAEVAKKREELGLVDRAAGEAHAGASEATVGCAGRRHLFPAAIA